MKNAYLLFIVMDAKLKLWLWKKCRVFLKDFTTFKIIYWFVLHVLLDWINLITNIIKKIVNEYFGQNTKVFLLYLPYNLFVRCSEIVNARCTEHVYMDYPFNQNGPSLSQCKFMLNVNYSFYCMLVLLRWILTRH